MTIREKNTLKTLKTKAWKSKRYDLYHHKTGLICKDISLINVKEISENLLHETCSKENYLSKSNQSKTPLKKNFKTMFIGLYVKEQPSFKERGYTKPT